MEDLFDPMEPVQESAAVEAEVKTVLPQTKPYMSWSRIQMFLGCGEQYRRAYVLGERKPPGISMVAGSATHASVEANMRHKLATGKLLSADEVVEISRSSAAEIIRTQGIRLLDDELAEIGSNNSKVREHIQDRSTIFSRLHHGSIAPYVDPYLIEHSFRLVTKGFPFDLVGVVDLQEQASKEYSVGPIRDTKTSSMNKSSMADDSDQMTLYAIWGRQVYGSIPPLRLDMLVATKEPKAVTQHTIRTDVDIETLSRRIECVATAIEKGVFLPAPTDSWKCSPKYCGFATTCPYYRKRISVPMTQTEKPPRKKKDKPIPPIRT